MIQKNSTRLIINTTAQYARTVINLILSLYSTRIILFALGVDDYGVYTLVAGIVSMLAFMTNAMVNTTQRFLSYHQTKSDLPIQQRLFSNSLLMHFIFSIIALLILEIIGLFLFNGFLNIQPLRIHAAKIVFQCAIGMILISFITAPFQALLISHENIVYISIIQVCDGVLKVVIAFLLTIWGSDKLILYGFLMLGVIFLDFLAYSIYSAINYKECVLPRLKFFDKSYLKSMGSFVGWQIYSSGCVIGRTQGTAIILNKFFGSIVNASFGIALQISGAVSFISGSLLTAINPQIVKAEGAGNRKHMLSLAETASKFSFLLLFMLVIPICFKMRDILQLWLGEVPEYSILFCIVILLSALCDQITSGLITANSAIGNVGAYALTIQTIKILTLPALFFSLYFGCSLKISIWIYVIFEGICAFLRLPFLKKTGGLSIKQFSKAVFFKLLIPVSFSLICYYILSKLTISFWGFLGFCIPISLIYLWLIYITSLNKVEKNIIMNLFISIKNRVK